MKSASHGSNLSAWTLTSAEKIEEFVRVMCTVRIQWEAITVNAGTVTRFLEVTVLTLTSVRIKTPAPKTQFAKILREAVLVCVTPDFKEIFAQISTSVP